jgi:hypothetical protein
MLLLDVGPTGFLVGSAHETRRQAEIAEIVRNFILVILNMEMNQLEFGFAKMTRSPG